MVHLGVVRVARGPADGIMCMCMCMLHVHVHAGSICWSCSQELVFGGYHLPAKRTFLDLLGAARSMLSFAVASSSFVAPGSRLSTQVSRGASVSMGSTADFKNGLTLEDENSVWKITSFLHVRRPVDTAVSVVPQLTTPALQAAVAAAAAATAAAAAAAASGRPASASTIRPCCA